MTRPAVASGTDHRYSTTNHSKQAGQFITELVQVLARREQAARSSSMGNFAAQLKDKLLGLVDRVVSCGGRGAGANKDVPEAPAKLPNVQPIAIKPRDPNVSEGSKAGVN
ncbi:hypothetical protein PAHAL_7G308400 [Panicum hallii]|uniref:Uncharacterized protein n=1 Tax=Panicum hallii TaxID=206008 RepID=A0A2S3IAT9_9POAL|nr:hypothetical protein PAHAL_7G308400 [Panicum hallii]